MGFSKKTAISFGLLLVAVTVIVILLLVAGDSADDSTQPVEQSLLESQQEFIEARQQDGSATYDDYISLAGLQVQEQLYAQAITTYQSAVSAATAPTELAVAFSYLGAVFDLQGNVELAKQSFQDAIEAWQQTSNPPQADITALEHYIANGAYDEVEGEADD